MRSKKIKILQVCAIDETVKSLLLPLIDKLTAEGFDVIACCSYGKNSDELRDKGYKIENIEITRDIKFSSNIKSVINLIKIIKKEKFDIVHVHTPVAALLGRIAAKLAGVPIIIYTAHGFYFHEKMSRWKYKMFVGIEKFAGRFLSDYIFTQSEEDRVTALEEGIIGQDKICTISNGVDVKNRFNPDKIDSNIVELKKKELNINDVDKVAIYIGRMVKEKGIFELVEAFNRISNNNFKLLLVGDRFTHERDNESYSKLNEAISSNKNIIATGRRADINDLLYMSDVFILPSYREGMPRSIIEAMAMGKPVIATNIRGCREEVVDGETGFLVDVNSPEQIKDKLLEILENPELETQMGRKARERAVELFDEGNVLDKELLVINKLISDKLTISD